MVQHMLLSRSTLCMLLITLPSLLASEHLEHQCPLVKPEVLRTFSELMPPIIRDEQEIVDSLSRINSEVEKLNQDGPVLSMVEKSEFQIAELFICAEKCVEGEAALDDLLEHNIEARKVYVKPDDPSSDLEAQIANLDSYLAKAKALEEEEDDDEEENPILAKYADIVVGKKLGEGGFKTVYLGTYKTKPVAIGVITPETGTHLSTKDLNSIRKEIEIQEIVRETPINARAICREFVMPIIAVHEKPVSKSSPLVAAYYLVMELAEGGDLNGVKYTDRLRALGAGIQLAAGLKCVHTAKFVHKDVKPLNTLCDKLQNHIYTSDFGLAAAMNDPTELARLAGTPFYMPWGLYKEHAGQSFGLYDVYALGVSFKGLKISKFMDSGFVASMVGPHATRPSIDLVLDHLATKALADVDASIQGLKDGIAASKQNILDCEKKSIAAAKAIDKLRASLVNLQDENLFERIVRCCTSRTSVEALTIRIGQKTTEMENAAKLKKESQKLIMTSKAELAKLETSRDELYERLTLVRTPTVPIQGLMTNNFKIA